MDELLWENIFDRSCSTSIANDLALLHKQMIVKEFKKSIHLNKKQYTQAEKASIL